ncbi:hypothetical protein BESB_074200 [Besnoitia besnoiti]|uniref:Uncharacterized protein n=1 Tax=Besnoitia besnoiti TaxID=94643 RepID=A0A2A9M726_BESBE|nr:uncharacterized protein BESB_074200 [Besnoitia besnoiti]PFH34268.1 hypothetical protein BESB_074200 [Besnoitia besnoiti]
MNVFLAHASGRRSPFFRPTVDRLPLHELGSSVCTPVLASESNCLVDSRETPSPITAAANTLPSWCLPQLDRVRSLLNRGGASQQQEWKKNDPLRHRREGNAGPSLSVSRYAANSAISRVPRDVTKRSTPVRSQHDGEGSFFPLEDLAGSSPDALGREGTDRLCDAPDSILSPPAAHTINRKNGPNDPASGFFQTPLQAPLLPSVHFWSSSEPGWSQRARLGANDARLGRPRVQHVRGCGQTQNAEGSWTNTGEAREAGHKDGNQTLAQPAKSGQDFGFIPLRFSFPDVFSHTADSTLSALDSSSESVGPAARSDAFDVDLQRPPKQQRRSASSERLRGRSRSISLSPASPRDTRFANNACVWRRASKLRSPILLRTGETPVPSPLTRAAILLCPARHSRLGGSPSSFASPLSPGGKKGRRGAVKKGKSAPELRSLTRSRKRAGDRRRPRDLSPEMQIRFRSDADTPSERREKQKRLEGCKPTAEKRKTTVNMIGPREQRASPQGPRTRQTSESPRRSQRRGGVKKEARINGWSKRTRRRSLSGGTTQRGIAALPSRSPPKIRCLDRKGEGPCSEKKRGNRTWRSRPEAADDSLRRSAAGERPAADAGGQLPEASGKRGSLAADGGGRGSRVSPATSCCAFSFASPPKRAEEDTPQPCRDDMRGMPAVGFLGTAGVQRRAEPEQGATTTAERQDNTQLAATQKRSLPARDPGATRRRASLLPNREPSQPEWDSHSSPSRPPHQTVPAASHCRADAPTVLPRRAPSTPASVPCHRPASPSVSQTPRKRSSVECLRDENSSLLKTASEKRKRTPPAENGLRAQIPLAPPAKVEHKANADNTKWKGKGVRHAKLQREWGTQTGTPKSLSIKKERHAVSGSDTRGKHSPRGMREAAGHRKTKEGTANSNREERRGSGNPGSERFPNETTCAGEKASRARSSSNELCRVRAAGGALSPEAPRPCALSEREGGSCKRTKASIVQASDTAPRIVASSPRFSPSFVPPHAAPSRASVACVDRGWRTVRDVDDPHEARQTRHSPTARSMSQSLASPENTAAQPPANVAANSLGIHTDRSSMQNVPGALAQEPFSADVAAPRRPHSHASCGLVGSSGNSPSRPLPCPPCIPSSASSAAAASAGAAGASSFPAGLATASSAAAAASEASQDPSRARLLSRRHRVSNDSASACPSGAPVCAASSLSSSFSFRPSPGSAVSLHGAEPEPPAELPQGFGRSSGWPRRARAKADSPRGTFRTSGAPLARRHPPDDPASLAPHAGPSSSAARAVDQPAQTSRVAGSGPGASLSLLSRRFSSCSTACPPSSHPSLLYASSAPASASRSRSFLPSAVGSGASATAGSSRQAAFGSLHSAAPQPFSPSARVSRPPSCRGGAEAAPAGTQRRQREVEGVRSEGSAPRPLFEERDTTKRNSHRATYGLGWKGGPPPDEEEATERAEPDTNAAAAVAMQKATPGTLQREEGERLSAQTHSPTSRAMEEQEHLVRQLLTEAQQSLLLIWGVLAGWRRRKPACLPPRSPRAPGPPATLSCAAHPPQETPRGSVRSASRAGAADAAPHCGRRGSPGSCTEERGRTLPAAAQGESDSVGESSREEAGDRKQPKSVSADNKGRTRASGRTAGSPPRAFDSWARAAERWQTPVAQGRRRRNCTESSNSWMQTQGNEHERRTLDTNAAPLAWTVEVEPQEAQVSAVSRVNKVARDSVLPPSPSSSLWLQYSPSRSSTNPPNAEQTERPIGCRRTPTPAPGNRSLRREKGESAVPRGRGTEHSDEPLSPAESPPPESREPALRKVSIRDALGPLLASMESAIRDIAAAGVAEARKSPQASTPAPAQSARPPASSSPSAMPAPAPPLTEAASSPSRPDDPSLVQSPSPQRLGGSASASAASRSGLSTVLRRSCRKRDDTHCEGEGPRLEPKARERGFLAQAGDTRDEGAARRAEAVSAVRPPAPGYESTRGVQPPLECRHAPLRPPSSRVCGSFMSAAGGADEALFRPASSISPSYPWSSCGHHRTAFPASLVSPSSSHASPSCACASCPLCPVFQASSSRSLARLASWRSPSLPASSAILPHSSSAKMCPLPPLFSVAPSSWLDSPCGSSAQLLDLAHLPPVLALPGSAEIARNAKEIESISWPARACLERPRIAHTVLRGDAKRELEKRCTQHLSKRSGAGRAAQCGSAPPPGSASRDAESAAKKTRGDAGGWAATVSTRKVARGPGQAERSAREAAEDEDLDWDCKVVLGCASASRRDSPPSLELPTLTTVAETPRNAAERERDDPGATGERGAEGDAHTRSLCATDRMPTAEDGAAERLLDTEMRTRVAETGELAEEVRMTERPRDGRIARASRASDTHGLGGYWTAPKRCLCGGERGDHHGRETDNREDAGRTLGRPRQNAEAGRIGPWAASSSRREKASLRVVDESRREASVVTDRQAREGTRRGTQRRNCNPRMNRREERERQGWRDGHAQEADPGGGTPACAGISCNIARQGLMCKTWDEDEGARWKSEAKAALYAQKMALEDALKRLEVERETFLFHGGLYHPATDRNAHTARCAPSSNTTPPEVPPPPPSYPLRRQTRSATLASPRSMASQACSSPSCPEASTRLSPCRQRSPEKSACVVVASAAFPCFSSSSFAASPPQCAFPTTWAAPYASQIPPLSSARCASQLLPQCASPPESHAALTAPTSIRGSARLPRHSSADGAQTTPAHIPPSVAPAAPHWPLSSASSLPASSLKTLPSSWTEPSAPQSDLVPRLSPSPPCASPLPPPRPAAARLLYPTFGSAPAASLSPSPSPSARPAGASCASSPEADVRRAARRSSLATSSRLARARCSPGSEDESWIRKGDSSSPASPPPSLCCRRASPSCSPSFPLPAPLACPVGYSPTGVSAEARPAFSTRPSCACAARSRGWTSESPWGASMPGRGNCCAAVCDIPLLACPAIASAAPPQPCVPSSIPSPSLPVSPGASGTAGTSPRHPAFSAASPEAASSHSLCCVSSSSLSRTRPLSLSSPSAAPLFTAISPQAPAVKATTPFPASSTSSSSASLSSSAFASSPVFRPSSSMSRLPLDAPAGAPSPFCASSSSSNAPASPEGLISACPSFSTLHVVSASTSVSPLAAGVADSEAAAERPQALQPRVESSGEGRSRGENEPQRDGAPGMPSRNSPCLPPPPLSASSSSALSSQELPRAARDSHSALCQAPKKLSPLPASGTWVSPTVKRLASALASSILKDAYLAT